jgi:single-strand DNA-binding protein
MAITTATKAPTPEAAGEQAESPALPAKVSKVGNLTREPELGFGRDSGKPYTRFGIAVNHPKVSGDWAGEQVSDFYEVSCFGSLAENVAESLQKGDRAVVVGRPELDSWEDKDGVARITKRIVADAVGAELRFAQVEIKKAPRQVTTVKGGTDGYDDEPF